MGLACGLGLGFFSAEIAGTIEIAEIFDCF
jgi:hypothetical protein